MQKYKCFKIAAVTVWILLIAFLVFELAANALCALTSPVLIGSEGTTAHGIGYWLICGGYLILICAALVLPRIVLRAAGRYRSNHSPDSKEAPAQPEKEHTSVH